MAKTYTSKTVEALKHDEATRKNSLAMGCLRAGCASWIDRLRRHVFAFGGDAARFLGHA